MIGIGLVLLAATGTLLYTEVAPYSVPVRHFSVEFPVVESPIAGTGGTAQDAQTSTSTVTFDQVNVTSARFEFSFTDNYKLGSLSPAGATFKVSSPQNVSSESTLAPGGTTATTVVVSPVCVAPATAVVSAATQEEAAKKAASAYPAGQNGTGDWTIDVTVARDHVSPFHPVLSSITWTVRIYIETYTLSMAEVQNG